MGYKEVYKKWVESSVLDAPAKAELVSIADNEKEIEERFYRELEFGTAGMRGILGIGTNKINIYNVRQASQGVAEYVLAEGEKAAAAGVLIGYDTRHFSKEFAEETARVLCANGIKAYLFPKVHSVPEVSFGIRELGCAAGVMITASHNPKEYNGYKVYGPDGGQPVSYTHLIFGGSAWVSTSAYFIGLAAIIVSGIMLKKTKMFAGDPAPFVMELPSYHLPTVGNVLRSMWERGWSFIKKAGTIILLSTILVWFTTFFGFVEGKFMMLAEDQIDSSILAVIGNAIAWIFRPLGWGNWQAVVASVTGLVAKENIVGTMGILYGGEGTVYGNLGTAFTAVSGFSFLVFNLLCAPCFAAIGAMKREMNNAKWTWFAIGYQCGFAYVIALMINQFGALFTGEVNVIGLIFAIALLVVMVYMLFRPYKEASKLMTNVKIKSKKGINA